MNLPARILPSLPALRDIARDVAREAPPTQPSKPPSRNRPRTDAPVEVP
jgi:hypothetical protein